MSNQKPRTIEEQTKLLRSRGMQFSSEEYAKECLSHISYFRLKYYWTDMIDEETEHNFLEDASFDDVIARYNFDRSLRLILFDAIEIIEVALRAKIINHLSQAKDSGLWYLDESLFEKMEYYEDFLLDLKYEFERSTEPFAKEYIAKHTNWDSESIEGDNPDAWMILEVATFGDHGVGSTDHLSRQTMRIKTVMNHNQENDQKNRPHDLFLSLPATT